MTQVFLSHSTADAKFAARLANDLRLAGIPVWKAPESVLPGEKWVAAIERGLTTSTHFLLLKSPAAVSSKWVDFEFDFALALQRQGKICIIPIDYQPCTPPPLWTRFQHVIGVLNDYEAALYRIQTRLREVRPAYPPGPTLLATTTNVTVRGDVSLLSTMDGENAVYPGQPVEPPSRGQHGSKSSIRPAWLTGPLAITAAVIVGALGLVGTAIGTNSFGAFGGHVPMSSMTSEPLTGGPTSIPTPTAVPTQEPTLAAGEIARQLAETGVAHNADWTPYTEEIDGVLMALVPAGCFQMGSIDGYDDERPVHEVCFEEPFWIDVYEVTNGQFAVFGGQARYSSNWTETDRPRDRITWPEADAFCRSRGTRLLTEAEWEYAARGPDGLIYPWGNNFAAGNVVYMGNSGEHTWAVGSRPGGASWTGALDLSGNVWEWVSDLYGDYLAERLVNPQGARTGDGRVLRGGSWINNNLGLRATYRSWKFPLYLVDINGFRCALSYRQ